MLLLLVPTAEFKLLYRYIKIQIFLYNVYPGLRVDSKTLSTCSNVRNSSRNRKKKNHINQPQLY